MPLTVREFYSDRYPTSWRDFDRNMPTAPTAAFGFSVDLSEINRWAARYRAAASYEQSVLVQYQSPETVRAYSALIRSTLVWSAFERFLPIVGLSQPTSGPLLEKYQAVDVAKRVRDMDEDARLFKYIVSKVTNPTLRRELDNYFRDSPFNPSYLLSAVRHIFGHGHLTPGSNETNAEVTAGVCNTLCDFHLHIMDAEFTDHVRGFEQMLDEMWS